MTGDELRTIRHKLGLSLVELGRALGYEGERNTIKVCVARYERGDRVIPRWIARLADMYGQHGVPAGYLEEAHANTEK